ncbi:MAG: PQQ-dependent sugar dehydrogenase [Anaerolineae bacterium]
MKDRVTWLALVLGAALLALALGGIERPAAAETAALSITLTPVATGFDQPVDMAAPNDGSGRLFIVEQTGKIRVWNGSSILPTPFLDAHTLISTSSERGLLSMALHPNYAANRTFFVYYTNTSGDLTLTRYQASASNPNVADTTTATVLLTIPHPGQSNHNGAKLAFGPDGYLYFGTGDGGGGGDPNGNAQNLNVLLGKMLRLDVDHGSPYAVPPTNPFVGQSGKRGEIWADGLRNPWRFSFDRQTGEMWIGDVGQGAWEEVDLQPAGVGGQNYGWNIMEGNVCYNATSCNQAGLTLPILVYGHGAGDCAIVGGYRYRGAAYPGLAGVYFYGDYCSGRIWGLTRSGATWTPSAPFSSGLSLRSFGEDASGELYVLGSSGVYRLADANAPTATVTPTATATATLQPTRTPTPTPTATPPCVIPGDFDANGRIDAADLSLIAAHWPERPVRAEDARYDLNHDGVIDVTDIMLVSARFGQTCAG